MMLKINKNIVWLIVFVAIVQVVQSVPKPLSASSSYIANILNDTQVAGCPISGCNPTNEPVKYSRWGLWPKSKTYTIPAAKVPAGVTMPQATVDLYLPNMYLQSLKSGFNCPLQTTELTEVTVNGKEGWGWECAKVGGCGIPAARECFEKCGFLMLDNYMAAPNPIAGILPEGVPKPPSGDTDILPSGLVKNTDGSCSCYCKQKPDAKHMLAGAYYWGAGQFTPGTRYYGPVEVAAGKQTHVGGTITTQDIYTAANAANPAITLDQVTYVLGN